MNYKLKRIFEKYKKNIKGLKAGKKTKLKILSFFEKNGKWPKRKSNNKREKALGTNFENFISKKSKSFDKNLRRIVMATGRKSNNKRNHDIAGFKKEILSFIEQNGRVPGTYFRSKNIYEGNLHNKMWYYVREKNDMNFLGEIYKLDKCYRTSIPIKYRPLINASILTEEPLINMAKYKLEGK